MYITGTLEIDPSQITAIKKVKNTKFFTKFVDVLTFGQASKKQETETFTAVSILEKIYLGLRSINIENIIRLSVDDYDFYLDEAGKEDDLEDAIMEFTAKVDPIESKLFNTIYMVMEHVEMNIKYLIEIRIKRKHEVGEYPIKIIVNGIANSFRRTKDESIQSMKSRMKPIFESQEVYETFTENQKKLFTQFLDRMDVAVKKFIEVDDIKITYNLQIIRIKSPVTSDTQVRHDKFTKPVYYGYYSFDDYFFYAWLWASMMFENNIYAHDFYLVDEVGHEIFYIGEDGFKAAEYGTLNPNVPFEPIISSDIEYYAQNEYSNIVESHGIELTDDENNPDNKKDLIREDNTDKQDFDEGNPDF